MKDIYIIMNRQNILNFYGSKLDLKLDSSELYDYQLTTNEVDYDTDVLDLSTPITYSALTIDQTLLDASCSRNTITLIEYNNLVNDSDYVYSGLTLTLDYNNFITHFGSPYRYTILNNDIYTFTGITGETHYFRIGGFNNQLNIDDNLLPLYVSPTPTPTITSTPTVTLISTSTPTPTPSPTPTPTINLVDSLLQDNGDNLLQENGDNILLEQYTPPAPTPTSTPAPTSTNIPTSTPTSTPAATNTPTPTVYVAPPNISYSQTTYTFTYAIFSQITIPAPVNTGGLVASYSIDVPLYPGLYFGIDNSGGISFQTRMSPGQFDIYVTASNGGGDDIKRIRIILTT
jgi:hypothetical protein